MYKAIILAGGLGTRLSEETESLPKPMVRIGTHPILWHILKYFAAFSCEDFYIATGYKGEIIKTYFTNYHPCNGDVVVDLETGRIVNESRPPERWKVHLIDTGLATQTGGRIKRLESRFRGSEPFFVTYGDGLADLDLHALYEFHRTHGRIATVTAVRPPARFGALYFDEKDKDRIASFSEKPQAGEGWINGGFFVFDDRIFDYLHDDADVLERDALERIAADGQLMAFRHDGFWQCMDTLREKNYLDGLSKSGRAPWKIWND